MRLGPDPDRGAKTGGARAKVRSGQPDLTGSAERIGVPGEFNSGATPTHADGPAGDAEDRIEIVEIRPKELIEQGKPGVEQRAAAGISRARWRPPRPRQVGLGPRHGDAKYQESVPPAPGRRWNGSRWHTPSGVPPSPRADRPTRRSPRADCARARPSSSRHRSASMNRGPRRPCSTRRCPGRSGSPGRTAPA